MKAEYANPFIVAATTTFKKELNVKLNRHEIKLKDSPKPSKGISIIIGITGMIKGQVVYSMDENMSFMIAKSMLPGKLPAEIRQLENSAISEIANIITGQASILLAGETNKIDITPPAVFMGKNTKLDFLNLKSICLEFISEIGSMEINIAMTREKS